MSKYSVGRAYEWEVRKMFEAEGYEVIRAAGSKGPFDLVARKRTAHRKREVWFVCYLQCKVKSE